MFSTPLQTEQGLFAQTYIYYKGRRKHTKGTLQMYKFPNRDLNMLRIKEQLLYNTNNQKKKKKKKKNKDKTSI